MEHTKIKEIFDCTFNHYKNILTPDIISYSREGDYYIELSTGDSLIMGEKLFGVTVLDRLGNKTELNECFDSRQDADTYINNLKR